MNWITKLEFNHPIQNPTLKSKARNKTELKLTYFLYPKRNLNKTKRNTLQKKKKKIENFGFTESSCEAEEATMNLRGGFRERKREETPLEETETGLGKRESL